MEIMCDVLTICPSEFWGTSLCFANISTRILILPISPGKGGGGGGGRGRGRGREEWRLITKFGIQRERGLLERGSG